MQKIRVAFSGPIYVSHHLLFKTVLSYMIIFLKQSQTKGLLGDERRWQQYKNSHPDGEGDCIIQILYKILLYLLF